MENKLKIKMMVISLLLFEILFANPTITYKSVNSGRLPLGKLFYLDGKLYGMTSTGGDNSTDSYGTIFLYNLKTNSFIKLTSFNKDGNSVTIDGKEPQASLTELNGVLYGMTKNGGSNASGQYGVIFKIDTSTKQFAKIFDFDGANYGQNPLGSLLAYNGKLYGTTSNGTDCSGTVFEFDPITNQITKVCKVNPPKGQIPSGTLTLYNNKIYGIVRLGINSYGGIFQYDIAQNSISIEYAPSWASDGFDCYGSLLACNGNLYGMTYQGGSSSKGVIFKYNIQNDQYSVLHNFTGGTSDGANPYGDLIEFEGSLYGLTYAGGTANKGVYFKFDTLTKKITILKNLSKGIPKNSLTRVDKDVYGLNYAGGSLSQGEIFKTDTTFLQNNYQTLFSFNKSYIETTITDNSTNGIYSFRNNNFKNSGKYFVWNNLNDTCFILNLTISGTPTSICINNQKDFNYKISIFPNPTKDETTIKFEEKFSGELLLYNINGVLIKINNLIDRLQFSINMNTLNPGIYYVILKDKYGNFRSLKINKV